MTGHQWLESWLASTSPAAHQPWSEGNSFLAIGRREPLAVYVFVNCHNRYSVTVVRAEVAQQASMQLRLKWKHSIVHAELSTP